MPILNTDLLLKEMLLAAPAAFGQNWSAAENYAKVELKKLAVQLAEIQDNVTRYQTNPNEGYSPETAKVLLTMQRTACESVLVAMTELTLLSVQKALDGILAALKRAGIGMIISLL